MRRLWHLAIALLMVSSMLIPPVAWAETPVNYDIPGGHFFKQANGQGGAGEAGFSITDEAGIRFWSQFKALGGVQALGYPISQRFEWEGFDVQATQRVVMQWRPEANQAYFVNVFDRLHDLGYDDYLESFRTIPAPFDTKPDTGLTWEQVTARHWKWLDESEHIKAVYWADSDPVQHFGLPTSFKEYSNVLVIRAQRAVFQYWLEDVPWAKKGTVTVALGGDIAKELGVLPELAVTPTTPTGAVVETPAVVEPVAVLTSPAPATAPVATGFGYGMQVDPGSDLGRGLDMTKAAGFNWAKVQLRWEELERDRGAVNWGYIDQAVNAASAKGVNLMFSVVTAPRWSRPADTDFGVPGPPTNPADLAKFVGDIAARHKGKVKAYEIWNEQNLWYEWGGRGRKLNATKYVEMLGLSYRAIKAADPGAIVLSGAPTPTGVNDGDIAYDDVVYLQMMYDAGLKEVCDAVAAHPSGYNNPPDDNPSQKTVTTSTFKGHGSFYFRRFEELYGVMERNGDGNKKIWFTEFGWASSTNPYPEYDYARDVSEQQQAEYLVRAFQLAKSKGYVGVMFVWNLNYSISAEPNDRYAKRAFAIVNGDWRPRPAYNALAQMPKSLSQILFIHGAGETRHVWHFQTAAFPGSRAIGLPGHSEGTGRRRIEEYVEWLHHELAGYECPVVMVGHSMGGAIALQHALSYPDDLRALVLVSTGARLRVSPQIFQALDEDYGRAIALMVDWAFSPDVEQRVRERSRKAMRSVAVDVARGDFEASDHFDVMGRLPEVRPPTLVISGTVDRLTPVKYAQYLADHIPGARLQLIEGAGHMVMLEKPSAFNRVLAEFVRGLTMEEE